MTSASKLSRSSPLDALLRKASSSHRRAREPVSLGSQAIPSPDQSFYSTTGDQHCHGLAPTSPLLHSHFRGSCITLSNDGSSYLDRSTLSGDDSTEHYYHDGESLYSNPSSDSIDVGELRNSWSDVFNGGHEPFTGNPGGPISEERVVPTVVISTIDHEGSTPPGKARSLAVPPLANFSRPVYSLPLSLDEQKRQVLERNSRRFPTQYSPSPNTAPSTTSKNRSQTSKLTVGSSSSLSETGSPSILVSNRQLPDLTIAPPSSVPGMTAASSSEPFTPQTFLTPLGVSSQIGGINSSSTSSLSQLHHGVSSLAHTQVQRQQMQNTDILSKHTVLSPPSSLSETRTPQEYVQLGIQHHEANRLKDSASCFEKGAKELGGCGVGMLMWGLTLRHGWGCDKDEKQGFKWLQRAAESAVLDLETARAGIDTNAVQTELVIAIYEVAQCFFQGWGVSKDQRMAVSYYTVAARLGDADAQHDLAFCLANGKGCKKDRKESAKWYRAAVAQGASDVGLAWIYKEKFQ